MTVEQKTGENHFKRKERIRGELIKGAEIMGQAKITVPSWFAAMLSGFPSQILEKTGILIVPSEEGNEIVVSEDRYYLLEQAFAWATEDEKVQNDVLVDLYESLFHLGQASMTPGVDAALILRPQRTLIELHAERFPPLRNLCEFIDGGGKLTDVDRENLAGIVGFISGRLKKVGHYKIEEWKGKGWTLDNMFAAPDE